MFDNRANIVVLCLFDLCLFPVNNRLSGTSSTSERNDQNEPFIRVPSYIIIYPHSMKLLSVAGN